MSNCNSSSIIDLNGGRQGNDGQSAYVYIAFADNVVAGNPDVVTTFSPNQPQLTSEWFAIRTSTTPLNGNTASTFDNYWVKIVGSPPPSNLDVYEDAALVISDITELDFAGSEGVGVDVTAPIGFPGRARVEITTAGLFKILKATFLTRQSTNELKPGAYYWICDTIDSDGLINAGNISTAITGVIVRAITTNTYDSQNCILISRVPDRAQIEHNLPFNEYYLYSNGDYTEAYNEVYVNISGAGGLLYVNNPAVDTVNWQYVLKNTSYYVTEINGCSYDVANNIITKRWDNKGNVITNTASVDNTGNQIILQCFRWGHYDFGSPVAGINDDTIAGNNITVHQDFTGFSSGRKPAFTSTCKLDLSTFSYLINNTIDSTSNVFLSTYQVNSTQIVNCKFLNGSSIDLVDINITPGVTIAGSTLKNTTFDATSVSRVALTIDKSNIFNNCRFTNVTANFENCQYTNSKFLDITTGSYDRDIGNNVQNINTNITNSFDNILKDTILTNCNITNFTYNTTQNLILGDYAGGLNMSASLGAAAPPLNYTVDTNLDIYSGANFGFGSFTALTYAAGQATITTVLSTTGIVAGDTIYLSLVTGTSAAVINNKYWTIDTVGANSITFTCPTLIAGAYGGSINVYFVIEQTSFTTVTNNKITDSIIRGINKGNRAGIISNNTFKEVVWQNYSRTIGLNSNFLAITTSTLGIDGAYAATNTYGAGTEASGTIRGNQFTKTGIYNSKLSNNIINNISQESNFYYAMFTAGTIEENIFEEMDINNVYMTVGSGYLYRNKFSRLNNITNCGIACLVRDNQFNAYSNQFHPATGNTSALNSVSFKAGSNEFSFNIFEGFSNVGNFVYDIPSTDINQSFSNNIFKDCPLFGGGATYNFDRFNHRENRIVNLSYAFVSTAALVNGVAPNPLNTGIWDLTITTRSPHLYKINEVINYTISTASTTSLAFQIGVLNTIPAIISSTTISGIGTIQSITDSFTFRVRVNALSSGYYLMDNANNGITGLWGGTPTGANNSSAVLSSWNTRTSYYENPADYECRHRLVTRNEDNDLTHRIDLSLANSAPDNGYPNFAKFYYADGTGTSTTLVYNSATKTLTLPFFVRNMAGTIILGDEGTTVNYDIQYINNLETNFPVRFIAAPGNTITFITVDRSAGGRPSPLLQNEILTNVPGTTVVIGSSIDFTTIGASQPLYTYDECWIKRDSTTSSPIGLNRIVKTVLN
jgi:hypothetical protein